MFSLRIQKIRRNQGANCSTDSYYSSQGRLDQNFCDRNVDLMEWISAQHPQGISTVEMETFHLLDLARCVDPSSPIYASAISLVLANRITDAFVVAVRQYRPDKLLELRDVSAPAVIA